MFPHGITTFVVHEPSFISEFSRNFSTCSALTQSPLFDKSYTSSPIHDAFSYVDFFDALIMVVIAFFCMRVCITLYNMTSTFFNTMTPIKSDHAPSTFCSRCLPSGAEHGMEICFDVTCRGSRFDANGVPHCRSTSSDSCANCTVTNPNDTFHPFGCLEDHFHDMILCSDCSPSGHDGARICSRSSCRGSRVDSNGIPHCNEYRLYSNFCANCDPTLDLWHHRGCLFTILPKGMATCTDCYTGGREDGVTICYRRGCRGSYVDASNVPHCLEWRRDGTFCNNCIPMSGSGKWKQYGCTG
jgi:hypothetical protein